MKVYCMILCHIPKFDTIDNSILLQLMKLFLVCSFCTKNNIFFCLKSCQFPLAFRSSKILYLCRIYNELAKQFSLWPETFEFNNWKFHMCIRRFSASSPISVMNQIYSRSLSTYPMILCLSRPYHTSMDSSTIFCKISSFYINNCRI